MAPSGSCWERRCARAWAAETATRDRQALGDLSRHQEAGADGPNVGRGRHRGDQEVGGHVSAICKGAPASTTILKARQLFWGPQGFFTCSEPPCLPPIGAAVTSACPRA